MEPTQKVKLSNEDRLRLASIAEGNGWTYVDIGLGAGTSSDNAWKIINRPGKKRSRHLGDIDSWLSTYAEIPKAETSPDRILAEFDRFPIYRDTRPAPNDSEYVSASICWWDGLPEKLIGSAKDLRSPLLDDEEKLNRFLGFVKELNQSLNGYIVAFERFGQK